MKTRNPIKIIYLSTYIPQKCGIATFTKDVTTAINLLNPHALAEIMAVVKENEKIDFPWEVKYKIDYNNIESYERAAEYINNSCCDVILIEHEFGIFGGFCGNYLINFLKLVKKPKVLTCHTLIDNPKNEWGQTFKEIVKYVDGITVMTNFSAQKLVKLYGVSKRNIAVIPHGTPNFTFNATEIHKKKKKLQGRLVLGNINLLSENKGIDYSIEAVAEIAKTHPEVLYLVIGQTHPNILKVEGEKYRNKLKKRIRELGIQKNVRFVNKYVSIEELCEWLKVMDIYITPYLDKQQSSSGALAYAVGAGKACISTPYLYGEEILSEGRGVIVPFRDSQSIAQTVLDICNNPDKRKDMESKCYSYGRYMTWSSVALQHLDFFEIMIKKYGTEHPKTN